MEINTLKDETSARNNKFIVMTVNIKYTTLLCHTRLTVHLTHAPYAARILTMVPHFMEGETEVN